MSWTTDRRALMTTPEVWSSLCKIAKPFPEVRSTLCKFTIFTYMNRFFNNLLNLFVPDSCLLCGKTLMNGEHSLCLVCQSKLPRVRGESHDNVAEHRVFGRIPYEHGASFCFYRREGDFASLIAKAKYNDKPWINYDMAKLFATELSSHGWPFDIDVVMPVPIHVLRRLKRGYNQSEPIAKAFGDVWHLPVEKHCLTKAEYTSSQVSHNRLQRLGSMEGTFRLKNIEQVQGKHVLLVDDVLTTGATLEACSQLLADAGARVSFLTLGLSD